MTPIPPLHELAKSYGATAVGSSGLTIISMPCHTHCAVDIGFTMHRRSLPVTLFRSTPRTEIADGVFAYGQGLQAGCDLIRRDEKLCNALKLLLTQFRCTVEWSGQWVSVRVGIGVADADSTGGHRFLSNLTEIADSLGEVGKQMTGVKSPGEEMGPARLRKIVLTAGFVLPLAFLFTMRYWLRVK